MARVKAGNTCPEIAVRRLIHQLGYRFRLHRRDLPGTPDLVLPKHRAGTVRRGSISIPRRRILAHEPKTTDFNDGDADRCSLEGISRIRAGCCYGMTPCQPACVRAWVSVSMGRTA